MILSSALMLLLQASVSTPVPPASVEVTGLQACVAAKALGASVQDNVVLARVQVDIRQPIAGCGCKSALVRYDVSTDTAASISSGDIALVAGGPRTIPIAATPARVAGERVRIALTCRAPD